MKASDLFDFPASLPFGAHFSPDAAPWEWVTNIAEALKGFDFDGAADAHTDIPAGVSISGQVFIHRTVKLPAYAVIEGPCWIGPEVEIRPGAYIRGKVIVGAGSVVGNSTELKNALLLENVQAPHFNYVGDSVLGNKAHLGAGVICANLRLDQGGVIVNTPDGRVDTGMRKLGALMGDASEAGCNAVLQPGTILGKAAAVMPTMAFGGYLEEGVLAFNRPVVGRVPRRDYPKSTPSVAR
ncbi:UDP-N-acetylglucosamine diphosphorylase [Ruficoccus sp. ZRK36]|uniref:acyltransferase n=1 Tax=Ruficoccus sp. ZRK36 TaxID=2866311 RepID=UPI001C72CE6A|nr:UDP-N-acetylglucosamine diphosphorylase [Ruficoccus sp. ZRK36]QYY35192.1 UDP-N-acetylglucosamine diphosphorylase [Ruficoccus sp. ZRK36]